MRIEIGCVVIIKGNVEEHSCTLTKKYTEIVQKLLDSYEGSAAPTSNLSFKMPFLYSHINTYPENLCVVSGQ